MKKLFAFAFAAGLAVSSYAQVIITGFGSADFLIDTGNSISYTATPGATSLTLGVQEAATSVTGALANPVSLGSQVPSSISLAATVTSATIPTSLFSVTLYSQIGADYFAYEYNAYWSGVVQNVPTTLFLNPAAGNSGPFDPTNIVGITLGVGGVSGVSYTVVLDTLTASAVPEPATYAAIFGLLAVGLVAYRRRVAA